MARYFLRKSKKTNECDMSPEGGYDYSCLSVGMGPVNPFGGPDKFDVMGIPKKRKKRKIK